MEFEQYGGYAKLGYEMTGNWNLRGDINITHFNASYPGPITAPLLDGDQRITRGVTSFAIENNYEQTSGGLSFFYNWGKHWINDGYTPSKEKKPQDGRFNSRDNMMGVSLYQSMQFFKGNRITAGIDWFRYRGKAWNEYVSGEHIGTTSDLVNKHENGLAGYVDLRQNIGTWLTFNAGLRADHHSRVGLEWVPQAGLAFHLPHTIEMKASASKGFRYPILREMYMFPPQNPDLQPESMWNYELAFSQQLLNGRFTYGVNLFYIDGKNLIETLPNPNGSGMLNQNSGEIENSGIELQAAWRISQYLRRCRHGRAELERLRRRSRSPRLEPRRPLSRDPRAGGVRLLHLALLPLDAPRLPADAAKQQPDGVLLPVHRRPAGCNEDGERPALRTADSPSRGFETTVLPHGQIRLRPLRGAVRPVAEEKPHHHRHEPQFRRERTAAGGLCGTDHTAVRQRLRHLLQAPSRRQLVGRLPRPVRGADAAAGPDAVRNLRLGAARQNRHDRRLPLDDLYLRTARQGGLPLCRRCRRTRPAAEHPFPRRRERGMDSVNAPGAEKRHPARVAFFSRKKIPRRSRGPGKQLFN